jgi:hypothetical protein
MKPFPGKKCEVVEPRARVKWRTRDALQTEGDGAQDVWTQVHFSALISPDFQPATPN